MSSLQGPFLINIRENNLLTTYNSTSSSKAQPSLTTLVHVPSHSMQCCHFWRKDFRYIPKIWLFIINPRSTCWHIIYANESLAFYWFFLVAMSQFWSFGLLHRRQCFLRFRFQTQIITITEGCNKLKIRSIFREKLWQPIILVSHHN